mgnify:CR=1 FL=1
MSDSATYSKTHIKESTSAQRESAVNAFAFDPSLKGEDVSKLFREGMSRLGASVNVITTMTGGGPVGFTATAVTSVTDTPPTLLVCLNRSSSVYSAFDQAEHLCVNVLGAGQDEVCQPLQGLQFERLPCHLQRGDFERACPAAARS